LTGGDGREGLRLEGLRIGRGAEPLLALDLVVRPGEVVAVMGPSGSGKSTLLAAVIGAAPAAFAVSGRVLLDGRDVTALPTERRRIGILFQDDVLFPHLSVGGNLAFGLPPAVRGRAARRARVEAALAEAGLAGFADRDPATLSGGQRTRVALMRALLAEPRALLLDEPFARLDAALRAQMRGFVFRTLRERGLPALMVTHDEADARAAGGPCVTLAGAGAAPADAPPPPLVAARGRA
jgi:putative thiamine transport system ATP-binding protein